jgi:serine/threonine protein kinase
LSKNGEIKLGDFGLATNKRMIKGEQLENPKLYKVPSFIQRMDSSNSVDGDSSSKNKTVGVGTGIYRSPELKVSGKYDEKVRFNIYIRV